MEKYRPIPDSLTIRESSIDGLGLFATVDIPPYKEIGVTHLIMMDGEVIRTPLGGFYNHSDTPNACKIVSKRDDGLKQHTLFTAKPIRAGEEITVKYSFYDPR